MILLCLGIIVAILNLMIGINDYRSGTTSIRGAASWLGLGVLLPGIIAKTNILLF